MRRPDRSLRAGPDTPTSGRPSPVRYRRRSLPLQVYRPNRPNRSANNTCPPGAKFVTSSLGPPRIGSSPPRRARVFVPLRPSVVSPLPPGAAQQDGEAGPPPSMSNAGLSARERHWWHAHAVPQLGLRSRSPPRASRAFSSGLAVVPKEVVDSERASGDGLS